MRPGKVVDIDKDMAVVVSGSLPTGLAHIYRFNGAFWEFDLTIDSPVSHKSVSSRDAALAIDGNVFVIGLPYRISAAIQVFPPVASCISIASTIRVRPGNWKPA